MKENLNQLIISGITGSQNEARITLVKVDAKITVLVIYLKKLLMLV